MVGCQVQQKLLPRNENTTLGTPLPIIAWDSLQTSQLPGGNQTWYLDIPYTWMFQWEHHLKKTAFTIWLFNIAVENPPTFKFGKPSISMGHGFHGYDRDGPIMYLLSKWLTAPAGAKFHQLNDAWRMVSIRLISLYVYI